MTPGQADAITKFAKIALWLISLGIIWGTTTATFRGELNARVTTAQYFKDRVSTDSLLLEIIRRQDVQGHQLDQVIGFICQQRKADFGCMR